MIKIGTKDNRKLYLIFKNEHMNLCKDLHSRIDKTCYIDIGDDEVNIAKYMVHNDIHRSKCMMAFPYFYKMEFEAEHLNNLVDGWLIYEDITKEAER